LAGKFRLAGGIVELAVPYSEIEEVVIEVE
jgi:hypothetical protein